MRPRVSLFCAVVAVGIVVVGGEGCDCGGAGDCPDNNEFVVDGSAFCVDDKDCAVDFGDVSAGLSSSKRVSFKGTCESFFFEARVDDDADDVFSVGQSAFQLGTQFNEGFVFIEAQPTDAEHHEGALSIEGDGVDGSVVIDLAVN